jgi:hypothetical protein
MSSTPTRTFEVPYKDPIEDGSGILSRAWEWFFRSVWERLYPLGLEQSFTLANNQASQADVTGMKFSFQGVTQVVVDFLIQRVTTGTGAVELIESGFFILSYRPSIDGWALNLVEINNPDNSGVDFFCISTGQVQYTSTNITGTPSISKLYWRARTLGGKNQQFSSIGKR